MSTKVDSLKDIYSEVAGDEVVVERQEDVGSREPIQSPDDPGEEVSSYVREDGLDDALEGLETED